MVEPARTEPPATTQDAVGCAVCGCPDRAQSAPVPPQPAPPSRCGCYALDWLKPPPPVSAQGELAPAPLPPLVAVVPVEPRLGFRPVSASSVPSPPHRILHCVWLC
jgi:hypothetical protein